MVQSDITTICTGKSKRSDATSLANFKLSLNRALEYLSNDFVIEYKTPFDCMVKDKDYLIVDGDYYKALEADFVSLVSTKPPTLLDGTDETPMDKMDRQWFAENYPYQDHASASKETPYYFYIEGTRIVFNKSNGSYTIRMPYAYLHAPLVNDASVINFPNRFKMCLAHLTLWDFYDDLDNDEKSAKHFGQAMIELKKLGLLNAINQSTPGSVQYNDN